MEALFIYLSKASGLIALFYLSYYFLLRKETFFNNNRWYLLSGLITSAVLPLLNFTKTVWVQATVNTAKFNWSNVQVTSAIEDKTFEIDWLYVFGVLYFIGVLVFLGKFAAELFSLNRLLKNKTIQHHEDFMFIDLKENLSPFSYFKHIVYNSDLYTDFELHNIIEHEKIHCSQYHTVDVLISKVFCALFWFNPLMWLYKKEIIQNLEYIADNEAIKTVVDKKSYQFTLLKITTHDNCVALTNHFYQSLIKKRIVMLNKNQSNRKNSWKYAFVLPLLVAFVFLFQVKVVAQEKESIETKFEITGVEITENTTDKELIEYTELFKTINSIDVKFKEIKRNKENKIEEIAIYTDNKKGSLNNKIVKGNKPIKDITITSRKDKFGNQSVEFDYFENNKPKGNGSGTIDKVTGPNGDYLIVINGKVQDPDNKIEMTMNEEILTEKTLEPKEAMQKYGDAAKNGAVEFTVGVKKGNEPQ
jgi:hypothetical protein